MKIAIIGYEGLGERGILSFGLWTCYFPVEVILYFRFRLLQQNESAITFLTGITRRIVRCASLNVFWL